MRTGDSEGMAAVKQACLLLLSMWAAVFLNAGYGRSAFVGGWQEQKPYKDPKYLQLAHYAVSTQTENRKVYDAVVRLVSVYTQVVAGVNYNITFTAANSNCVIGKDMYTAKKCNPAGPVNKLCSTVLYVVPWMNTTQVTSYTCSPYGRGKTQ
uniref:Cystatin domain-containing protein n=1 Tax=Amblyomma maculatum TaxID=34609 RepID=G3MQ82_AMBMU